MYEGKNYRVSRRRKLIAIAVLSALNALMLVFFDCLGGCSKFTFEIRLITLIMLALILVLLWSVLRDKNLEQKGYAE